MRSKFNRTDPPTAPLKNIYHPLTWVSFICKSKLILEISVFDYTPRHRDEEILRAGRLVGVDHLLLVRDVQLRQEGDGRKDRSDRLEGLRQAQALPLDQRLLREEKGITGIDFSGH